MEKETDALSLQNDGEVVEVKKKRSDKRRTPEAKIKYKADASRREAVILESRAKGLNITQIAKVAECAKDTVRKTLKKFSDFLPDIENIEDYQHVRQQVLSAAELKLLRSVVDEGKLAAATVQQTAYALDKVHTMRRLDAGQSTANVEQVLHTVSHDGKTKRYSKD